MVALSSFLNKTGTGGYKIIFEDEMLEAFPEDYRTRETLEAALKKLSQDGCVDVKYVRGDAFCLAFLKDYLPPCGDERAEADDCEVCDRPYSYSRKMLCLITAVSAFLGAAAGAVVAAVI